MVQLRAFIFGSVMDLYWGHTLTKNCAALDKIFKIIFKDFSHFALFPHAQYALRYTVP